MVLCCFLLHAQPGVHEEKCSVEGTVVNAFTGEPLKKVHLTLRPLDQPNAAPYGANTDAAGHFLMDQLDPGRYTFSGSRNGFITQSYSPDGNLRHSTSLTLAKGQELKELVFKLTPQGVISGRVLDEDGEPLADVFIQPMVFQYQRGKRQLTPAGGTSTNDLGEFRLHNLRPGKYLLGATWRNLGATPERIVGSTKTAALADEGYVTTYHPSAINPSNANEVEVAPGAQVNGINITLARARTVRIRGHVSLPGGKVPRGFFVSLMPQGSFGFLQQGPFDRSVDPQGNFEIRG
ncbi:MAG: MSCRAMM family protein, partial [Limisphaerales bacterium]